VSGLIFKFQEVLQEIDAIAGMAKHYIDKDSTGVLPQLKSDLEQLQWQKDGTPCSWEIPRHTPLRTVRSEGAYEAKQKASRPHLVAELTSKWVLHPMRTGTERRAARFALGDVASTAIRLFDADVPTSERCLEPGDGRKEPIAEWHMEFADAASPGCYFHVQVPWKPSIPVPRLPTYPVSPLFAFEFVLGELFQKGWESDASTPSAHLSLWRSIQAKRLNAFLRWQTEILSRPNIASPWLTLKQGQPHAELLSA
jgi:hypothetical protein